MADKIDKEIGKMIDKFARRETQNLVGIFISNRTDVIEPFIFRLTQILERFYNEITQAKVPLPPK